MCFSFAALPQIGTAWGHRDCLLKNDERDEERKLLEACRAVADAPWLEGIVILAIESAMRRGELVDLQWKHVSFRGGTAFLPDIKDPELTRSRTVPLTDRALKVLAAAKRASWTNPCRSQT